MRSRLTAPLVALLLALTLTGQTTAAADPEVTGPRLPDQASDTARERAEDALARAQALFTERGKPAARRAAAGHTDATMVLNQLLRVRDDLSDDDREQADALLARPTDGGKDPYGDGYCERKENPDDPCVPVQEEEPLCGDNVCIHYVATTDDAPPPDDEDGDGVPDAVEAALETAESVHLTYTNAGYRPPDPDDGRGGDDRMDIYLADVGAQRLYGYCTTDQGGKTYNRWAYCVIDDDFSQAQFPTNTPGENRGVTLAHEYFHAIQYAYDFAEDAWFMEATATWAEDELFDAVDDNHQYLTSGQLGSPWVPLDTWVNGQSYQYGNWVFFRYLTERWSEAEGGLPILVRELIEKTSGRAGDLDMHSTQAIQSALAARGTSFTSVYGQFADANRRPARTYSEGQAYPVAAQERTWRLTRSKRSTGGWNATLDHLTNLPLRFKPRRLGQRDWRLRMQVDMPARATAPVARVAVYLKNGKVRTSAIRLNRKTRGSKVVPFSSRKVKYVELVLVNASRRTECWNSDWTYACMGTPIDDQKRTDFQASIFRR